MQFRPPDKLLSDNRSNLIGEVLTAYIKLLSIKHRVTTPYHSRMNSKVENLNRTIKSILIKMLTN
jgi:transposase InsO family protein